MGTLTAPHAPPAPTGVQATASDGHAQITWAQVPLVNTPQVDTYTVTASNQGGSKTATLTIAVVQAPPTLLDVGHASGISQIRVSDLILVNERGDVVEGEYAVNAAAFAIHSQVHSARPDVVAAAHAHSMYGKSWSTLGRLLDPLTQDACAFYEDHVVFDDYTGVVEETSEGDRIARALGTKKAAILRNHGLLTVGQCVDEAAWWFITMDRSCQAQLLAEAAGEPHKIPHETAKQTYALVGKPLAGWFQFQPLYDSISREQPDLFE